MSDLLIMALVETIRRDYPDTYDYEALVRTVERRVQEKVGRPLYDTERAAMAHGWQDGAKKTKKSAGAQVSFATVTYEGTYDGATGKRSVIRTGPEGQIFYLAHQARHSSEFNWGYHGSGPADLARSILADLVPLEVADQHEFDFRDQFVARFGQDQNWTLFADEVRAWLRGRGVEI
jgi:hypothetical protein